MGVFEKAEDYPDSPRASQALFFVANNQLIHNRNRRRAVAMYHELIVRYPNSREASHAVEMLARVHTMSDAQIRALSLP